MRIVHISDTHFGKDVPVRDEDLITKINSYAPDLVLHTGDHTEEGTLPQFEQAGTFLSALNAPILSISGNHDVIHSADSTNYFHRHITPLQRFSEETYLHTHDHRSYLFCALNSCKSYKQEHPSNGHVKRPEIETLKHKIQHMEADVRCLVLHHPLFGTTGAPLENSGDVLDFIEETRMDYVFHGHNHKAMFTQLYGTEGVSAWQLGCGTMRSTQKSKGVLNSFAVYENLLKKPRITLVEMECTKDKTTFTEVHHL